LIVPEPMRYGKSQDKIIKILVVDDEPDVAASFRSDLEEYGFNADAYTDPEEALQIFKPDTYDLLLLDINMPKLDGFELFEKIQKRDPQASACFITAFENYFEGFKQIFPGMEIDCYIRKPISKSELAKKIHLHVHRIRETTTWYAR
jgi:two-component system, OmpR family, response regulator ChvI